MNRQRLILFVLVIGLAVAVVWSYLAIPRQKTVGTLAHLPEGAQTQVSAKKPVSAVTVSPSRPTSDDRILNLALLETAQSGFTGYRRNIFRPVFVDELKIMRQKAVASKPPQIVPVQPPKVTKSVEKEKPLLMPESSQKDLARFTFLGFMNKDGERTVFLAKDKDILLVKQGEKFAGRYEVATITDQALTIIVTNTGDEIVIPLIENKPLTSAN